MFDFVIDKKLGNTAQEMSHNPHQKLNLAMYCEPVLVRCHSVINDKSEIMLLFDLKILKLGNTAQENPHQKLN